MVVERIRYVNQPTYGTEEMKLHPKVDEYIGSFAGQDFYYEIMFRGSISGCSSVNIKRFRKDDINQVMVLVDEVNF